MDSVIDSCMMHIEELLEVFLDEVGEMPVMEEIVNDHVLCYKCQMTATYKVSGSEVKATWE